MSDKRNNRHDRNDSKDKKGKGRSGDDTLIGGAGNDHLEGERGNDVLYGNAGNDHLDGGEGNDTLFGGSGNDNLDGGSGNDLLVSNDGVDKLDGGSGHDTLEGGASIDLLDGGSGNDRLTGGGSSDLIDGGSGFDTAVFSGSVFDYRILDLHRDTAIVRDLRAGSPDGIDLLHDVEALEFSDAVVYLDGRNNAPIARADAYATGEDDALLVAAPGVLSNDKDMDDDTLSVASAGTFTSTLGAAVMLNEDGSFTYDASSSAALQDLDDGETAVDTFTYVVSDGHGGTATQTVGITVAGATDGNRPPVAVGDAFEGDEDEPITGNVLGNDTDPDEGDTLTVTTVGTFVTAHGSVTVAANGDFTYVPDEDYFGEDSFDYTVQDATGAESTATVTLTVNPVNDLPTAVGDSATLDEDTPSITGDVLVNDTDPETPESLSILNAGTYETALGTLDLHEDGTYLYTLKDAAQTLADGTQRVESHLYVIGDDHGDLTSNFLTITITGANDVPVAEDDAERTDADVPLEIGIASLLQNDSDVDDGDSIEFVSAQDAVNGSVEISGDHVVFTPDAGFSGDAEFSYTIRDESGETDTATVSVRVRASAEVLLARNDGEFTRAEDEEFRVPAADLLLNDSGLGISVVSLDNPVNGFVDFFGDQVHFIPDFGFSGKASFTYTIEDATGAQATATVKLDYDPVADLPVVFANDAAAAPGVDIPLFLEANLDDLDGSETLEIMLTDVFEGASFFRITGDGFDPAGNDLGGGTWEFTQEELLGLHVSGLPLGSSEMTLSARATETATGEFADSFATFNVTVGTLPDGQIIFV